MSAWVISGLSVTFKIFDAWLAIGAWVLLGRE